MASVSSARVPPVAVPSDLGDDARVDGPLRLPLHIRWSGRPITYDLTDRRHVVRVYEQVLREGTEDDVRRFVRASTLVEVWDELFLPEHVREAWLPWITARRSAQGATH